MTGLNKNERRWTAIKDYSKLPDAELVRKTADGDDDAFAEIVARYKNYVFAVVRQNVKSAADAEDMAQETFIDCWRGINSIREPEKLRFWLYGTARRKSIRYMSRLRRSESIDEYEIADNSFVEDRYLISEKHREVREAINRLSEKNRVVCGLFYLYGWSVERISYRLDLPQGTVKSRLFESRNKLREELKEMEENETLSKDFDKELKKKVFELRHYYSTHGESWDGFDESYSETEKYIKSLPDSKQKNSALAEIYYENSIKHSNDAELRKKAFDAAQCGGNVKIMTYMFVEDAFAQNENYAGWLDVIDNKSIPELRKHDYVSGEGVMRFWRGYALYELERYEEAYAEFKKAADMIDREDNYHACTLTAVNSIELGRKYADDPHIKIHAMSETYYRSGCKLLMISEPGFGWTEMPDRHRLDALGYYCSRYNNAFYDTSLAVGVTMKTNDGDGEFTVISYDETVIVPAGEFDNAMHVRYVEKDHYAVDVWYAKKIGLLKADFTGEWAYRGGETYELSEYDIKGGDGYYPFALGNRWRYMNSVLPEYLFYRHEVEVDWVSGDGNTANVSYLTAAFFVKDYEKYYNIDSSVYLAKADDLSSDWKLDEAVECLKKAVRSNTAQEDTALALSWIPVMSRFEEYHNKGWRFCPGSMSDWTFRKEDGAVKTTWGDWSIGPYRLGTRGHKEDRIFGMKPLRYLGLLAKAAWNDEWKPGYTETHKYEGIDVTLTAEEGGTVTVPAGTFDNCVKLTIYAEKPDSAPEYYFADNYRYMYCGTKEFWYAPGVGIVKHDCRWGDTDSSCVLVRYDLPAANDSMFPVQIGNKWEYDEVHLTEENYRAKFLMSIICGMGDKFTVSVSQEFIWQGTEEEYENWKKEHDKAE